MWYHPRYGTRPFDVFSREEADHAAGRSPGILSLRLLASEAVSYDFESLPSISDVAADDLLEAATVVPTPMEGIEEEPEPEGDDYYYYY